MKNNLTNENKKSMQTINVEYWAEVPDNFTGLIVFKNGPKYTLLEGARHSFDDNAAVEISRSKYWYKKDQLHRVGAPAIIYHNGNKEWWYEHRRHRSDGPAIELANGNTYWYFEGKLHRTDGPAITCLNGFVEYSYNNIKTTKEALELLNKIMKLKNINL